jgi:hypothetical protein
MGESVNQDNVLLSIKISYFLNCCKEFGVFDIAILLDLDAWVTYKICEALVENDVITKIDEYPDDPDFDDIRYFSKPCNLVENIFNILNELDAEISEPIRPVRSEIMDFARNMERVMGKHDSIKGDSWKTMSMDELLYLLSEEVEELASNPDSHEEFIDIANFCMMLWNRAINN